MIRTCFRTLLPLLLTLCCLACTACSVSFWGTSTADPGIWKDALYAEDTALGEGELTFTFKVKAADRTVSFTVSTDCTVLGDALMELELVVGNEGPYGLYVTHVNGMEAREGDKAYWCLYEGDVMAMTGIDGVTLTEGGVYTLAFEYWS